VPRSRPRRDPPELFIDRSLGYHALPDALRELGFVVHTMRSVFGPEAEESVPDVVWLEQAGRAGWVVLTKDDAIRRRPVELQALAAHGVRAFCLTNANLTGEQQRDRFLANINRMLQRSRRPGPWICAVYERQLVQIWPRRSPR
jgi:PIN like domain